MNKKASFAIILIGLILVSFSFYNSAASVQPKLDREVSITLKPIQETGGLVIESLTPAGGGAGNFRFDKVGASQNVVSLKNTTSKPIKVKMDMTLDPDHPGNHWELNVVLKTLKESGYMHHQNMRWHPSEFTIEPSQTIILTVAKAGVPNQSGTDVNLLASISFTCEGKTERVTQQYRVIN